MKRLLLLLAGGLTLILGGCGDDGGTADARPDSEAETPVGGGLAMELTSEPEAPKTAVPVTWILTVRNEGVEEVTLTFNSGQPGDVTLTKAGQTVYQWSKDRMFSQNVSHDTIKPNEEKAYRLDDSEPLIVPPGEYEATATLESSPAPDALRRTVEVKN